MKDSKNNHTNIADEIKAEENRRSVALVRMFKLVPSASGGKDVDFRAYLEAASGIDVDAYVAACEDLSETWTNTYSPPPPGAIREVAKRYAAKSRLEIQAAQDKRRMDYARKNTMTHVSIAAELNRVHNIPLPDDEFECRVETSRRASLLRILDRMEGRAPPAPPKRKRGDGGLQKINLDGVI